MDKTIVNILKKLEKNGFKAFIVGGYVRDKFLGKDSFDVDLCTNALPKDIKEIFNVNGKTNDNYGSVNIKVKKYNIDITTFRIEKNYNNHSPKTITYVDDVLTDLKRRDFTINSILINKDGEIIDYYNGIDDLNNKKIKCIGDVQYKLSEDPLRMLRAIRFSVIYDFALDDEIIDFINHNKHLLNEVSFYRKKEELDKILVCKNKIKGLNLLKEFDLCKVLGIKYLDLKFTNDLFGMYAQLEFDEKYPLTKNEKQIIKKVREILEIGEINNYVVYKYGLYISSIASEILGMTYKDVNKIYNALPIKEIKDIKINLESIVKLNNNCYNRVNEIYERLEVAILNGTLKNKSKDIVKFLRK